MAEPDIQRYLDDVGSQHQPQSRFMTHLTKILEKVDVAHGLAKEMSKYFWVKEAKGDQLDVVAKLVGSDRRFPPIPILGYPSLLPDDIFRMVVLAKIAQNQWDGTNASFKQLWDDTLGDWLNATFTDNQDMTMNVDITGTVEAVMTELILAGYIIPKPMGVGMNVEITQPFTAEGQWWTGLHGNNSATIRLHYPYAPPQEDAVSIGAGSKLHSNAAAVCIPIYQSEQQDTDEVMFGAVIPHSFARYSVTIQ